GDAAPCAANDVNADGRVSSADLTATASTVSAPPPQGPTITYLGFANSNGGAQNPLGSIYGVPVYFRNNGFSFKIVVEARTGTSGALPGKTVLNTDPNNPARRPD